MAHRTMTAVAALLFGAIASHAVADSVSNTMAMQVVLSRDGFLSGKVDGRIGPATTKGIAAYAAAHQLPSTKSKIMLAMKSSAQASFIYPVPEEMWALAVEAAKRDGGLYDPASAVFKPFYWFKASDGKSVVCGGYNAKNLYGAYVGEQTFQTLILAIGQANLSVVTIQDPADSFCVFGVSLTDSK